MVKQNGTSDRFINFSPVVVNNLKVAVMSHVESNVFSYLLFHVSK